MPLFAVLVVGSILCSQWNSLSRIYSNAYSGIGFADIALVIMYLFFSVIIFVPIVFSLICIIGDVFDRIQSRGSRTLWLTVIILCAPVTLPVYMIINRKTENANEKPAEITLADNKAKSTIKWVFVFLPLAYIVMVNAQNIFTTGFHSLINFYITFDSPLFLIYFLIKAVSIICIFATDTVPRLSLNYQRGFWLASFIFFGTIALPIYRIKYHQ